jgi:hypothetical protein
VRLNNELRKVVDESAFQHYACAIFDRLGALMADPSDRISVSKSFICRSVPQLRDMIGCHFGDLHANGLLISFIRQLTSLASKFQTSTFILRLIKGIVGSGFFESDENIHDLLPHIALALLAVDEKFNRDVMHVVAILLFIVLGRRAAVQDVAWLTPLLPKFIDLPDPDHIVLLLLYFGSLDVLRRVALQTEERFAFYGSLLRYLIGVLISPNSPDYFRFTTPGIFIRIVSLSQMPEFEFVHEHVRDMVELISAFYNAFLAFVTGLTKCDHQFFHRLYRADLQPIAALLPSLLAAVPISSRFNRKVFLPLFHFYVTQRGEQTRASVIDGFCLIIEADLSESGLVRAENAIIRALDELGRGTIPLNPLRSLFSQARLKVKVADAFFDRLTHVIGFFAGLSRFPIDELYEDERTTAIWSVLGTCRRTNDTVLYQHFAQALFETHKHVGNESEAAEALLILASCYHWEEMELVAEAIGFPEQARFERKHALLCEAADLFMQSGFFERALAVYRELEYFYGTIQQNYPALARLFAAQSQCCERMYNSDRPVLNRFYGVRFYGVRFSEYYKDQIFIYRRGGFFMGDQMTSELRERFPEARVESQPPTESELSDPGLFYVHVFNVKPRDLDDFDPYTPRSDLMVKAVCSVTSFYSETPVRKPRPEDYGEFAEWHRHIVRYKTEYPLQNAIRRAPVVETSAVIELSPIECAIVDVKAKTMELVQTAAMYWRCVRYNLPYRVAAVSSFSMLANGIVNAAVNGGTKIFQNLFLELLKDEPINAKHAPELKKAFADQLKVVAFALRVHSNVMSTQYIPLHENIMSSFASMKTVMEQAIGPVNIDDPPEIGVLPSISWLEPYDPIDPDVPQIS